MARKSRKNIPEVVSSATVQTEMSRPFRAGLYVRISMETEETLERGTIETQVELMKNFVADTEDISVAEVYKDSDYSGTNFDRPGFVQMMEDIKHGKINCVIVKDLSRLGRNYVETSNYIERVFPFFHVRFLAVTDDFDSFREGVDLTVPLKNIINEFYSKDLAKKCSSAKKALWKKGKFTSAWEPYGYRKSEEDYHQLIVDEEAAEHLKSIFSMYMDGRNYSDIARQLNKDGVLSPTLQRKFYKTGEKPLSESKPWNNYEVKRVLQDVHCTGDSVFGKYQQSVFQGNKQRNRPESEWVHVENTHEGIIDRELFQQVQSKIQEYTEAYKKKHQQNNGAIRNHNFYTGKIWCGGCGNRMTLSRERNGTFFYICGANTNHKSGGKQCKGHRVRKEYVDDDVLRLIQTHMKTVLDTEKMIQEMNAASQNQTQYLLLDKEVGKLRRELSRISKRKSDLYEDYSERLITEEEYIQFSRIYSNEIENIKSRLSAEDDNVDGRAKKESDSVTSQRILLKSFVIDQLGVAEADILEYVDDGVSGTHFKRQGFQQLQDDMKSGEIGCVVVKDFSRFGRDYLEVGFYIEYIFPLLQIRFISINDSYDSASSSGMTGGMNVALQNLVYNMYSLDLSKKISSAMQTRTKNGTRLPVNARYGYKKGKDGRLEVDPEAAKVVKMIFRMAAEGTSFADITWELNRQAIATCDEQKLSRGDQVQFQRFDTIKKKHWSPTTVAAIVRDEIYIGTRIWGKTRCSMHTGHKAVLNDETEWVRLENHHTAIIDRALFEKANEMHPKKKRSVAESRTNFTLERRKKQPALLICANCGHSLLKETEHLLKCSDARTNGDPVCRSLVIRREPLEENILGLVHQYAASMLEKEKKVSSNRQCDYKEINTAELQKQSRQLTSEKMKLYDDYKDGRIDRDSYKQRAGKISVQLDEIKRKIEDAENSKKLLEQNELSDKIKLKDFLGIQKFDTEKLREIIKVICVHSQDEIEIEWNFDDIFSEQR